MLTLAEHGQILRANFPQFRTVEMSDKCAAWEGDVQPSNQSYRLHIKLELPPHLLLRAPTLDYYPRVYVLDPVLRPKSEAELGPLPHVWYDKKYQGQPNLCLFHPSKNEWDYSSDLASTTIPDACEWLYFYEIWDATGKWYGGGDSHSLNTEGKLNNDIQAIRRDALSGASEIAMANR